MFDQKKTYIQPDLLIWYDIDIPSSQGVDQTRPLTNVHTSHKAQINRQNKTQTIEQFGNHSSVNGELFNDNRK